MNDYPASNTLAASADPLEKSVLVTLLDDSALYKEIAEVLEPTDFISEAGKQIFSWISYEVRAGRNVDAPLGLSHFNSSPRVSSYLIEICSGFPTPANLKRHCEELRDLSIRVNLSQKLAESSRLLIAGEKPVEEELMLVDAGIKQANARMNAGEKTTSSYKDVGAKWKERFKERATKGGIPGLSTGFDDLDNLIKGFNDQNLIIVGGRPSMGKTTVCMNMVEHSAIKNGIPWLVFSMEMPKEDIYERSLASIAGIDFEDLRMGRLKNGDLEKLKIGQEMMDNAPLFIDDQPALTLNQVVARSTKAKREHGIRGILIDYLQLMTLSAHFKSNRNEGVGEISRGLKQLARDLGLPVVALSQLSRDLERRPNKRPINSDLRDSGSIEQDADVIAFVYRDEVYNPDTEDKGVAEFIIGKQRNGPLGTVRLGFANGQSRFENMGKSNQPNRTLSQVAQIAQQAADQRTENDSAPELELSFASHVAAPADAPVNDDDLPF